MESGDSKLRQRRLVEEDKASESEAEILQRERVNASDTDDRATIGEDIAKTIGQDKPPDALDQALGGLPPRWKSYMIRLISTWLMIGGFGLIIYGGPLALMVTTFLVQVKVRRKEDYCEKLQRQIKCSEKKSKNINVKSIFSVSRRLSTSDTQCTRWTTCPGSGPSPGISSLPPTTSSTARPWLSSSGWSSTGWTSSPCSSSITG